LQSFFQGCVNTSALCCMTDRQQTRAQEQNCGWM
jgi:hypothetical protein